MTPVARNRLVDKLSLSTCSTVLALASAREERADEVSDASLSGSEVSAINCLTRSLRRSAIDALLLRKERRLGVESLSARASLPEEWSLNEFADGVWQPSEKPSSFPAAASSLLKWHGLPAGTTTLSLKCSVSVECLQKRLPSFVFTGATSGRLLLSPFLHSSASLAKTTEDLPQLDSLLDFQTLDDPLLTAAAMEKLDPMLRSVGGVMDVDFVVLAHAGEAAAEGALAAIGALTSDTDIS
mmetsp:Transcript_61393/g.171642  ORF Transcript_61393/g.171642 Transcript_61393/m.171642 type:complete len:241 (-) Transcript_61393:468-1190(-)